MAAAVVDRFSLFNDNPNIHHEQSITMSPQNMSTIMTILTEIISVKSGIDFLYSNIHITSDYLTIHTKLGDEYAMSNIYLHAEIKDEALNGLCTIWYKYHTPDRDCVVTCTYINNLKCGQYTRQYNNGAHVNVITCWYSNNIPNGIFKQMDDHICKTSANFVNGKRHGHYRENDSYGNPVIKSRYYHGLRHGIYMKYYPNNVLAEYCSKYTYGKRNGTVLSFNKNGILVQLVDYANDIMHGNHITFPAGQILIEQYSEGVLIRSNIQDIIPIDKHRIIKRLIAPFYK